MQIATDFFNLKLETKVMDTTHKVTSEGRNLVIVKLRLNFDNTQYVSMLYAQSIEVRFLLVVQAGQCKQTVYI